MIRVSVLFFATLRDLAGTRSTVLELAEKANVNDLKRAMIEKFPALEKAMDTSIISINHEFAMDEDPVPDGAEVAAFPPVSGGSVGKPADRPGEQVELPTKFAIIESDIDLNELLAGITLPSTGAACLFTGMVRGVTRRGDPHETTYLEYEAYRPMAEAKMQQVADEIRARWPSVEGIAIVQRIGRLDPGTPTVLIGCTSAHRDTGVFEAARYGIDRLKEIVPVWKKEVGPSGETWIEGDYHPGEGDR